jgi:hypothetical protein
MIIFISVSHLELLTNVFWNISHEANYTKDQRSMSKMLFPSGYREQENAVYKHK